MTPWGWQIDGHHLNLNFFVLGDQLVFTPSFMGSEPCSVADGPLAGTRCSCRKSGRASALMRALDGASPGRPLLRRSIMPDELPPELDDLVDGRIEAGACQGQRRAPLHGRRGDELSDAQRRSSSRWSAPTSAGHRDDHAAVKMAEVEAHLDET